MTITDNSPKKPTIVITSINPPNDAVTKFARGAQNHGFNLYVIGDLKSPKTYDLSGVDFFDVDDQQKLNFNYADKAPVNHYARKNIGYLKAIEQKAPIIVDTDDDNIPYPSFWDTRTAEIDHAAHAQDLGWTNVYSYFIDELIWPRGLPLDCIHNKCPQDLPKESLRCPIQQGLANDNPDVDAIYRLVLGLPKSQFRDGIVMLGKGAWSPFNSQNTTWWPEAFPLLYLPAFCSFRMTDIWRSFVAQRIAWANGWAVMYHSATVYQERNQHNLMRDFSDEVPGYLMNDEMRQKLSNLNLKAGQDAMSDNLKACYDVLINMNAIGEEEWPLLSAWIADIDAAR